ncbi:MAG: bifunctional phosphoglucose/phosphomannose isomerase [Bacteroidota bacterium]
MDENLIQSVDPSDQRKAIHEFFHQVEQAVAIGNIAKVKIPRKGIRTIVLTGLGGSAIGGDLLRSYLSGEIAVPIIVNRFYSLPEFVDSSTLVIISSYSGNTEETISAYKDAIRKKAAILCITTGGVVAAMAKKYRHPRISIPAGLQPRAALGYSFFPLLATLFRNGYIKNKEKDIKETIALLHDLAEKYSSTDTAANDTLSLAERVHGKLPIIYSSTEKFDSVNLRWRSQICENAKQLAYGNVFPELNHNELVGWKVLRDLMKQFELVVLRDKDDHKRVAARMDITQQLLREYAGNVTEVHSQGKSLLARMFSLIHFGDWVSYWLAILNHEDPAPVKAIDFLKSKLAELK